MPTFKLVDEAGNWLSDALAAASSSNLRVGRQPQGTFPNAGAVRGVASKQSELRSLLSMERSARTTTLTTAEARVPDLQAQASHDLIRDRVSISVDRRLSEKGGILLRPYGVMVLIVLGSLLLSAVAGATTTASRGRLAFSGDVCGLLTSQQVASVKVTPLKCTSQKPVKGSGGTLYYGNWGGTGLAPHLSVSVNVTSDAAGLQQAKKFLGQFPHAKKVSGIGSLAYESTAGDPAMLNFVVGNDVVNLGLETKQPLTSVAALTALGKAIAAKL
jgi:hypothetical protein